MGLGKPCGVSQPRRLIHGVGVEDTWHDVIGGMRVSGEAKPSEAPFQVSFNSRQPRYEN